MDNKRKFVTPKDMIAVYKQLEQKLPKRLLMVLSQNRSCRKKPCV